MNDDTFNKYVKRIINDGEYIEIVDSIIKVNNDDDFVTFRITDTRITDIERRIIYILQH